MPTKNKQLRQAQNARYWLRHRDKINQARRERYAKDADYRRAVLFRNRQWRFWNPRLPQLTKSQIARLASLR